MWQTLTLLAMEDIGTFFIDIDIHVDGRKAAEGRRRLQRKTNKATKLPVRLNATAAMVGLNLLQ